MNKALKYFAAFSMVLNLVLAGVIAGQAGRYAIGHFGITSQEAVAALPEEKRKLLKEAFQGVARDMAEQRAKQEAARNEALRILTAEPFDAKAYIAQAQLIYQLRGPISERTAEAVANVAAQYTPAERATLGEIFRHHWQASLLNSLSEDEKEKK